MFPAIRRFFTDEATFKEIFGRGANWLRGAFMIVALGILSGIGPFAPVSRALGEAGYLGAGVLIILTVLVSSGDRTPAAVKAFQYADPVLLKAHLESLGVSREEAKEAVIKTVQTEAQKITAESKKA